MKLSRVARFLKRLQLGSKTELTTKGLTFEFFCQVVPLFLSSYRHERKFARFAQLWLSFNDMKYLRWLVWEVFWSVLYLRDYFLTIGESINNWWASSMQSNLFPMFYRPQAFNCQSSDESILWLLLKILYSFFIAFFSLSRVCPCSTAFRAKVVFWSILKEPINSGSCWCPTWCQKRNLSLLRLGKTWRFSDAYKTWSWC